ncbi:hypothetical protein DICSQDRAFT_136127 [Dichomitus squalens LYAD-421 SS1]|uniref:Ubiquitin 3 binding protein But2 C-terminal domain-containing protein n=1 Tax=Dichomitus squalens (strain LYAD-421) TaxID=732165 RepID=R7T174_DICSQ|nr:uncharacterized protein DICSQDRAFT_136127 [Dichomitus squalens LYAD-421 SS1]EJF62013.1 hypothetical protein DICSQDRAFT_136127 [Dichomitus squalens LYAD-421 SS1]
MPSRRSTQDEQYALLQNGENGSQELDDDYSHRAGESKRRPAWYQPEARQSALTWILALLVIVVATDGIALFYMSRIMKTVFADLGTDELEFANPYHGLETLYRSGKINASKIDPIQNLPRVVAQVFPDRPKELAPIGEHDLFNKVFGTLSPHEKHLHVSPNVHTIAQFRALDFGMEECSVVIQLPGHGDRIEGSEPFRFNQLSVFDVYRLNALKPLDVRKLSYSTKPPAQERVASLMAKGGEETLVTTFPCPWGTLHTFEVVCGEGSDCLVDIWSSQNTTYGIYMYQHQTI